MDVAMLLLLGCVMLLDHWWRYRKVALNDEHLMYKYQTLQLLRRYHSRHYMLDGRE